MICASRLADTIPLPGRSAGGTVLFFMGTPASPLCWIGVPYSGHSLTGVSVQYRFALLYRTRHSLLEHFCRVMWHVGVKPIPQFKHASSFAMMPSPLCVSSILPHWERFTTI